MNYKFIHIVVALVLMLGLIISCGDNGTGSSIVFEPGMNFIGTYQVQPDPAIDPVLDTMLFQFRGDGTFYMQRIVDDTTVVIGGDSVTIVDNQRGSYCNYTQVDYDFIAYTDSLRIEDSGFEVGQCNPDYNPYDTYAYRFQSIDIMLYGSDETINRLMILWTDVE